MSNKPPPPLGYQKPAPARSVPMRMGLRASNGYARVSTDRAPPSSNPFDNDDLEEINFTQTVVQPTSRPPPPPPPPRRSVEVSNASAVQSPIQRTNPFDADEPSPGSRTQSSGKSAASSRPVSSRAQSSSLEMVVRSDNPFADENQTNTRPPSDKATDQRPNSSKAAQAAPSSSSKKSRPNSADQDSSSSDEDIEADTESERRRLHTPEENKTIRFLVSGRVYPYPNCGDSWCANYVAYVRNNHPAVAMCLSHGLHPFRKHQRLIVFLNGLFFAIFISFVVFETTLLPRVATCREGCVKEAQLDSQGNTSGYICEGGYNDGLNYDYYHHICQYYHPWELAALCGLFVVIYQSTLQFMATCSCIQGRSNICVCCCCCCRRKPNPPLADTASSGKNNNNSNNSSSSSNTSRNSGSAGGNKNTKGGSNNAPSGAGNDSQAQAQTPVREHILHYLLRRGIAFCGGGILLLFTIISTVLLIWALIACYVWGADFSLFADIVTSKVWSLGEWFVWSFPYFTYKYPTDRRRYLNKQAKKMGLATTRGSEPGQRRRTLFKAVSDVASLFA